MLYETDNNFYMSFKGMVNRRGGLFSSDSQRDFMLSCIKPKIAELVDAGFEAEDFWEEMTTQYAPLVTPPMGSCVFVSVMSQELKDAVSTSTTYTVVDFNGVLSMDRITKKDESITSVKELFRREGPPFHSIIEEFKISDAERKEALATVSIPYHCRVEVTGIIKSVKNVENGAYGGYKMRLAVDSGYSAWGSIPSPIVDKLNDHGLYDPKTWIGLRVTLTATLAPSKDDPLFVFFSRPAKSSISETAIALKLLQHKNNQPVFGCGEMT